ncbi:hypothetical protein HETIRDRAFT_165982 [Heterobasidion irregulare TC 32-1]|uniref:Uncharacterized protein n=1 Tax=Heterobasidion irregulare (strain TC 32-1) TaxID=747525 RepID=W4KKW8_HETIT|nr:uncharacterized protein HETIRDRAFT_165982 [Heterobasidion irregulare TC 32-1]ETW86467.1 hypothetical protein HETIRDRAFT_165982 [Heterobasidion irregulare TC 32-1]
MIPLSYCQTPTSTLPPTYKSTTHTLTPAFHHSMLSTTIPAPSYQRACSYIRQSYDN